MNLTTLLKIFSDINCETVYVKELVKNNNSKQQIYIASGDTKILNVFPVKEFTAVLKGNAKEETFHAACDFYWVDEHGKKFPAPNAKFILYPKYPEVRFSGFIQGCTNAPSEILNNTVPGRLMFFGISKSNQIFGYVVNPESEVAKEFWSYKNIPKVGVLHLITIQATKILTDTRNELLQKLTEIYNKGWIESKQLKPGYIIAPCNESRCGGLTLEAELGIIQNGKSEPDYLGWEIKQFGVKKLHLVNSARITLMTPEPDGGVYKNQGGIEFVKQYGYPSKTNPERMDFTGYHKNNVCQTKTGLTLCLDGFDTDEKKIFKPSGGIYLIDKDENIAASWSFAKMLTHWNKKHAKASYIPSLLRKVPTRQYQYSNKVILAEGTDFTFFLQSISSGMIIYDPGIHIDNISTKPSLKPRSQFRILSKNIKELYTKIEVVDLNQQ